jgi:hypothetical protein
LGKFLCAHGDDPDHGSTDAVKDGLHPGQPSKAHIGPAQRHHHEKRWQHEGDAGKRGAANVVVNVAEVNTQLRGKGPRRHLGQSQPLLKIFVSDPLSVVHQIPLHVAHQGYWPAKPECSEPEHIQNLLPERVARCVPSVSHV